MVKYLLPGLNIIAYPENDTLTIGEFRQYSPRYDPVMLSNNMGGYPCLASHSFDWQTGKTARQNQSSSIQEGQNPLQECQSPQWAI